MKIIERPSPNHDSRGGSRIDMLVLHYTGMKSAEEALVRLCDPDARVSAHYTIDRDGIVYRHVPEARRAWHAGVSWWAGERNVNACSIGIELVNPGHEFGYIPFAEDQISALIDLAGELMSRHPIASRRVLGHSDVAPSRKTDPGELFPWRRLAGEGIGMWPAPCAPTCSFSENLSRFGYGAGPETGWPIEDSVRAFQRHFRPSCIDGIADEECERLLAGLLAS
ncbi:MAG TPA: N-acetylmuramoyl-L-alanine amidase [Rhizomicrobium sp.]|nr:N-acetylmuramoyl-L-alanine amidase [Rhizomicrobium sp.]